MLSTERRKKLVDELGHDMHEMSEEAFLVAYTKAKSVENDIRREKFIWEEAIRWYIVFQKELNQELWKPRG